MKAQKLLFDNSVARVGMIVAPVNPIKDKYLKNVNSPNRIRKINSPDLQHLVCDCPSEPLLNYYPLLCSIRRATEEEKKLYWDIRKNAIE
jgi:hypothetical protein